MIAGRYTLVSEVGRGGMGVVWRALDEVLDREVAIKRVGMMPGGVSPDLARAEREARLAASLNHPNVVAVFDLITDDSEQWLVMEYVDNRTLAQLVRDEGPLEPDDAARLLHQAASALAAAHSAGIVHRDVKPSNILVTATGQVKLSDFGIARAHADATLTQTGLMSGSPAYLAPEIASGGTATAASDVWAIGATLYHALTGHPPFDVGNNLMGALYQIVHSDPPRPENAGWLLPVLEATMSKDPEQRWSMDEVRDFLAPDRGATVVPPLPPVDEGEQTVMLERPAPEPEPDPAPVAPPIWAPLATTATDPEPTAPPESRPASEPGPADEPERSRRWLLPVLLVAALALVVGLGLWALSPGDGERPDTTAATPSGSSSSPDTGETGSDSPTDATSESPSETASESASESPSESESTEAASEDEMIGFTEDYFGTVTSDPRTTWGRLTPEFQAASESYGAYRGFWSTIESAQIEDIAADPAEMVVSYTVTYTRTDGSVSSESNALQLVLEDGQYYIADEY